MSTHIDNPPTCEDIVRDCQLVAVVPLGGEIFSGAHIYMNDHPLVEVSYWIIDRTHSRAGYVVPRRFDHLHEAIRRALSNSGWGDYKIEPPEGITW